MYTPIIDQNIDFSIWLAVYCEFRLYTNVQNYRPTFIVPYNSITVIAKAASRKISPRNLSSTKMKQGTLL